MRSAIAALILATAAAAGSHAASRQWEQAGSGWYFDAKEVKTELKDGVVNTENTIVFQLLQHDGAGKPQATAEPSAQLYVLCESRQYRLWDVASSTQMGPITTQMFDVAQNLEGYCSRIGKLPEEKKRGPGQR